MAISDYANVINFPQEKKLALYPELDFTYTMDAPEGHTVSNTDRVFLKVFDPLSMKEFATWTATNDVADNKFKWQVPYGDIYYLPHGARYRIYLQFGLPDTRILHQTGLFVWIGR